MIFEFILYFVLGMVATGLLLFVGKKTGIKLCEDNCTYIVTYFASVGIFACFAALALLPAMAINQMTSDNPVVNSGLLELLVNAIMLAIMNALSTFLCNTVLAKAFGERLPSLKEYEINAIYNIVIVVFAVYYFVQGNIVLGLAYLANVLTGWYNLTPRRTDWDKLKEDIKELSVMFWIGISWLIALLSLMIIHVEDHVLATPAAIAYFVGIGVVIIFIDLRKIRNEA